MSRSTDSPGKVRSGMPAKVTTGWSFHFPAWSMSVGEAWYDTVPATLSMTAGQETVPLVGFCASIVALTAVDIFTPSILTLI